MFQNLCFIFNFRVMLYLVAASVFILPLTADILHANELDLSESREGVKTVHNYHGTPNEFGVLENYSLKLPEFTRGVYYQGYWWPSGGNRVYAHMVSRSDETVQLGDFWDSGAEGGIFLLLELSDGGYLAVLPLVGTEAYAWIDVTNGKLEPTEDKKIFECATESEHPFTLKLGHHGRDTISGDQPLCAWARSDNPYTAIADAWRLAAESTQGRMKLRSEKKYPDMFEYLGWCSWDGYHKAIDDEKILGAIGGIKSSGIPIRYVLMDDGHYDEETIGYDQQKFPESYASMVAQRDESDVRWMGIWYAMFGTYHGMKDPEGLKPIQEHLYAGANGKLVPKANLDSVRAYYEYIFRDAVKHDFDLVKIDFQTHNMPFLAGNVNAKNNGLTHPNPVRAATVIQQGFHEVIAENFEAMINCNWHNGTCLFNSYDTVAGRCCEDNRSGPASAISHTYHAFTAMPWLGQIAWGDHDMFHSGDASPEAVEMNAMAKALSGGPVYLSDKPEDLNAEAALPLCYADGRLLRPLAPGVPLMEDLFQGITSPRLFRAMAPLPHDAVAVMVMNFHRTGENAKSPLTTTLTNDDYASASALIQPCRGELAIPDEGLLAYDFEARQAQCLGKGREITITGFGSRLIQLLPIRSGCCVIGRVDKYLSPTAIKSVQYSDSTIDLELYEAGPFAVWSKDRTPIVEGLTFESRGDGLFIANIEVGGEQTKWKISLQ